jgi:MoxR-like ATPase
MSIQVVGRRRELELVRAALASGAHILLEGPPGTGKSTLLRQVAESRRTEFVLVEGSAELTPADQIIEEIFRRVRAAARPGDAAGGETSPGE